MEADSLVNFEFDFDRIINKIIIKVIFEEFSKFSRKYAK